MLGRSSNSSVLRWPERAVVDTSFRQRITVLAEEVAGIETAGYYGSYARGDWGVGSDLDVFLIVSDGSAAERKKRWDFLTLPVPVDVMVLRSSEFLSMKKHRRRFVDVLENESVVVCGNFPTQIV